MLVDSLLQRLLVLTWMLALGIIAASFFTSWAGPFVGGLLHTLASLLGGGIR